MKVTLAFRSDVVPLATILWAPVAPAEVPDGMLAEQEKAPVPVEVVVQSVTDGGVARPVL